MKTVATIQARMGSSRLPGKVLLPIVGRPMLAHQIERIQRSQRLDALWVATSTEPQDNPIEALAQQAGVPCFRGSEHDVLSRLAGVLSQAQAELHVEFMGDSPLPDPGVIDEVIDFALRHRAQYDYVSNALTTTYPPGADVTVYPAQIFFETERQVTDPTLREHGGWNITQRVDPRRIRNLEAPPELHHPDFHIEVDTQEDLEVVSAVFEHFLPDKPHFTLAQIIDFLKSHPELAKRNRHVERRWKSFLEKVPRT